MSFRRSVIAVLAIGFLVYAFWPQSPAHSPAVVVEPEAPELVVEKAPAAAPVVTAPAREPASVEIEDETVVARCGSVDLPEMMSRMELATVEVRQIRWTLKSPATHWLVEQTRNGNEILLSLGKMKEREDQPLPISSQSRIFPGEEGTPPFLDLETVTAIYLSEGTDLRDAELIDTEENGTLSYYGKVFWEKGRLHKATSQTETTGPMAFQRRNGNYTSLALMAQDAGRAMEIYCVANACDCEGEN